VGQRDLHAVAGVRGARGIGEGENNTDGRFTYGLSSLLKGRMRKWAPFGESPNWGGTHHIPYRGKKKMSLLEPQKKA